MFLIVLVGEQRGQPNKLPKKKGGGGEAREHSERASALSAPFLARVKGKGTQRRFRQLLVSLMRFIVLSCPVSEGGRSPADIVVVPIWLARAKYCL